MNSNSNNRKDKNMHISLDAISDKLARSLSQSIKSNDLERMKMKLGIEVFLHDITMIFVILAVAFFLGILKEAALIFVIFGIFRINAGGLHFTTSFGCLLSTGCVILGGAALSHVVSYSSPVVILLFLLFFVLTIFLAPVGTANNPIAPENRRKYRQLSSALVILYAVLALAFPGSIRSLLVLGSAFEIITLLPPIIRLKDTLTVSFKK